MKHKAKIIAVVGAGGKTTRIHQLAKQYRQEGKTVFVTTTTHMWREPDTILSGNLADYENELKLRGYCMAGMPADEGKIKAIPEELFLAMEKEADILLVEADGSNRMPVKMPSEKEPVIPVDCDEIHVVMGLNALGRTFKEAAHRLLIVKQKLGVEEDDIIMPWHIKRMIEEGYVIPLRKQYPNICVRICPSQMKTAYERSIGKRLIKEESVCELVPKIDLVLLAAGNSTRFGLENKLLQKVNGKPLYTYAIDLALKVRQKNRGLVDQIILVTAYQEVISYAELKTRIQIVFNDHPEDGISRSIRLATEKADQQHALLFMVCDQPNLQKATVEGLMQEYVRQSAKAGYVKRLDGSAGNPCIFHPDLREQLLKLTGDIGGKKVLSELPEEQKCCYFARQEEELTDIDTRDELELLLKRKNSKNNKDKY